jgi:phosphopantothenoylcysteine decarboxylase/phosphopantothenate--cysteine ligase
VSSGRQSASSRGPATRSLALERTTDILSALAARKGRRLVIGFAAETHAVVEEAARKLRDKRLDLIVANDVTVPGAGFGSETNVVHVLGADGLAESLPVLPKDDVAGRLLDWVVQRRTRAAARPALRRVR